MIKRPAAVELPAVATYKRYIGQVPEGDVLHELMAQSGELLGLLAGLSEEAARRHRAPGKWSIKDVVGHLTDSERVLAYRCLRIARADQTPLPGFEPEEWARAAAADRRPLGSLLEEFRCLRAANLALFASFDDAALARRGTADGVAVTVPALIYFIAGHTRHHLELLRGDQLPALAAGT